MKTEGIIYIQVPHQGKARAFTFKSQDEFIDFLRQEAPVGFSYRTFTREEWMTEAHESGHEIGSDWWNEWVAPGIKLFDAGADQIAEVWRNESNRELIPDPHPEEEQSLLWRAVDDFNTHYYLGHDEAVRILNIGPRALYHAHQQYEAFRAIEKAADDLGWWQEHGSLAIH